MAKRADAGDTLIADNRKAFFDYHVIETFEAGVALLGTEVKSAREGRINLRDSYCRLENGEAVLLGVHIGQYSHDGGYAVHDPTRPRKLLLHRDELRKLLGRTTERGLTIVPLRMYFKGRRIKVAIALVKGKKTYDKRETIKRREAERETRAAIKSRRV
jgi:SsrA-binding protein